MYRAASTILLGLLLSTSTFAEDPATGAGGPDPGPTDQTRQGAGDLWEKSQDAADDAWRRSRDTAERWWEDSQQRADTLWRRSQETADQAWNDTRRYLQPEPENQ